MEQAVSAPLTARARPGAALSTAAALLVGVGGLLLVCLTLPAPGEGTPPDARAWLAGILGLLVVGALGVRGAAQGESRAARTLPAALTLILAVLGTEALLRAYAVPAGLIPTPGRVLSALWTARSVLLQDTYTTFVLEALLGFLAGTALGLALALLVVRFRFLELGLLPYAALFSSIPIVALAPVIVKAVGLDWPSKTVVVAVTVLFPVVVGAVRGLQSAAPLHLDLMHTYAARPEQTFRDVRIPTALPFLFGALKVAPDDDSARHVEARIWAQWSQTSSDTTALLMSRAKTALEAKQVDVALKLLTAVVKLRPDYIEGWNRRATIYYLQNDYTHSLEDIEQVLVREPRHFGALAGLGMIMQELGDEKRALDAFRKALAVNPRLEKVPELVKTLTEKVEGRDI